MIQTVWIEIPVKDLDRALKFYQVVFELGEPVSVTDDGVRRTATLTNADESGPGFSLNQTRNFEPGDKGPLVYVNAGSDSNAHLERVRAAGGTVIEGETSMGAAGYYATFKDTEGNLLSLYSYR